MKNKYYIIGSIALAGITAATAVALCYKGKSFDTRAEVEERTVTFDADSEYSFGYRYAFTENGNKVAMETNDYYAFKQNSEDGFLFKKESSNNNYYIYTTPSIEGVSFNNIIGVTVDFSITVNTPIDDDQQFYCISFNNGGPNSYISSFESGRTYYSNESDDYKEGDTYSRITISFYGDMEATINSIEIIYSC